MRYIPIACLCVFLIGCGSSNSSRRESKSGDGGAVAVAVEGCEALEAKIEGLYRKSAISEEIPANLQSDYLSANLHMVMKDCQRDPAVLPCLQRSRKVAEIESDCLLPLDDKGSAEAREFSAQ